MAYAWIAFYEKSQFVKEVIAGRPPAELPDPDGGRPLRLTSLQLYGHDGAAFIEQLFDGFHRPISATISVPRPDRAGTVPCHIIGWQETVYDERGQLQNVQHLAHVVEDGRIIMSAHPLREDVFARARRRLHPGTRPFTWAAVYDQVHSPPALYQFDPTTGVEVSGEHIDRRRLVSMVLTDGNGDPWVEQVFTAGQRVIYRRRVEQPVTTFDPIVVFLLGWQRTAYDQDRKPVNVQHVSYTFEQTGRVIMSGPFDDKHPVFHGMVEVPADRALVGVGGEHKAAGIDR